MTFVVLYTIMYIMRSRIIYNIIYNISARPSAEPAWYIMHYIEYYMVRSIYSDLQRRTDVGGGILFFWEALFFIWNPSNAAGYCQEHYPAIWDQCWCLWAPVGSPEETTHKLFRNHPETFWAVQGIINWKMKNHFWELTFATLHFATKISDLKWS